MPKRKGAGRASKPPVVKRKASSSRGSSSLSPVKSAGASPGITPNLGLLGSSTGGSATPGGVIDEDALQAITDDINEDVEAMLQVDPEPALPDIGEGGEMDFDLDPAMANEIMEQLQGGQISGEMQVEAEEEDGSKQDTIAEEEDEEEDVEDEDGLESNTVASGPSSAHHLLSFSYPAPASNFLTLSEREKSFKTARFVHCQSPGCGCTEMLPPQGAQLDIMSRAEVEEVLDRDDEDEGDELRTGEGWWRVCGACGHGWEEEGTGHTWPDSVVLAEKNRRGKVVGRIEELLYVSPNDCSPSCIVTYFIRIKPC